MLSQTKEAIYMRKYYKDNSEKFKRRYRLNINGCRDQKMYIWQSRKARNEFLKSLPVDKLLTEVGYFEM